MENYTISALFVQYSELIWNSVIIIAGESTLFNNQ